MKKGHGSAAFSIISYPLIIIGKLEVLRVAGFRVWFQ
jgi:hypothetical protein